jgi:AcrR family transcriptional regulator
MTQAAGPPARTGAIPRGGVREALLDEAMAIVAEQGVGALSFREVSRRLGVSHQAPYKHFASRDDIVAALMTRCFGEFATALTADGGSDHPALAMRAMGEAYLRYGAEHPAKYALMFETPMPDPPAHPAMMHEARRAFGLLKDRLAAMLQPGVADEAWTAAHGAETQAALDLDALFVWSVMHGLATILKSDVIATLGFTTEDREGAIAHCLARISRALGEGQVHG